jgi:hypothetical protein
MTNLEQIQELAEAQRILAKARMDTCNGPGELPHSIVYHASLYIVRQIDELWAAEIGRPLDTRAEIAKAVDQGLDLHESFGD